MKSYEAGLTGTQNDGGEIVRGWMIRRIVVDAHCLDRCGTRFSSLGRSNAKTSCSARLM